MVKLVVEVRGGYSREYRIFRSWGGGGGGCALQMQCCSIIWFSDFLNCTINFCNKPLKFSEGGKSLSEGRLSTLH